MVRNSATATGSLNHEPLNHESPSQQITLRTPAIARIRKMTNNSRNKPARTFAIANDATRDQVKPSTGDRD